MHSLADLWCIFSVRFFQARSQELHCIAAAAGYRFFKNLAKGVITQQQMYPLAKGLAQPKGTLHQPERKTPFLRSLSLVQQLVKYQMSVGVLAQAGEAYYFIEVALVAMEIAGVSNPRKVAGTGRYLHA